MLTAALEMPRTRLVAAACLVAVIIAIVAVTACRQGMPVIDPGERPPTTDGTISGTVRGPEGTSSIAGRQVEVVNVATGERQRAVTSNAGGFTFKVKPGKYRVEVALLAGESILKAPGVMNVNRSDVDAHADFIVGSAKASRPRAPAVRTPAGLGPPIA
ncbi:MAG TPA: carboxypeptidase-like regulatory domain-containing protein [Vicinamibacterales bacterium]|jgi:hypothetical protein